MDTSEFILHGPPEMNVPGHMSFSQYVYDRLKAGGHNVAQISAETGEKVTFDDILQRSVNLAVALRKLGVRSGDVIGVSAENRFEFTETTLAIMFCGAIVTTSNISYTKEDLLHTLKLSKPKIIFYSPLSAKHIPEAKTHLPSVETLIYYGDESTNGSLLYKDLLTKQYDVNKFQVADVTGQVDTLLILYSSGTTGLPKGVMLTHLNLLLVMKHLRYAIFNSNIDGNTKSHITLSVLPWFHAFGFITQLVFLSHNIPMVLMHRFNEKLFLKSIQDYKVSLCFLAPPIVVFLAKHPVVDKYNLTSLNEIWCGAAPLSEELQNTVTKRLNIKYIRQAYGMTELTLAVTMDLSNERRNGTAGKLMPGFRGKVVDIETNNPLGPYQKGQLCFKSGLKMKGYIGNLEATASMLDKDGYTCTGDIGYYDDDGFFYIVDRIKELIKYKGFQVAPAELEALLLRHPGVRDAGVTGVPDEQVGELPMAYIVKQANTSVTEKDIIDFVASKVSPSKYLRGGVKFVNEIPKNPSGKILRRKLKENLIKSLQSKL